MDEDRDGRRDTGRPARDAARDRDTTQERGRADGGRSTGRPPPSKAELARLLEDRKRDHQRGPQTAPSPRGPGGANQRNNDRRAFERNQNHMKSREERIDYIRRRLQNIKGRARDDFDRSR